jgi:hypothetical protein
MVYITENIFDDDTTNFYLDKIKNEPFIPKFVGFSEQNYYNRYKMIGNLEHEQIAIDYLKKLYINDYCLICVWINRIDSNSFVDDSFHYDSCDLTIITYLNDNFSGGEFQYIDDTNSTMTIVPKKNLSIIINNSLPHKVLPVSSGIRYSLVYFFNNSKKTKKTLL